MATGTSGAEWNAGVATGVLRLAAGAALLRWRGPLCRLAGAADDDRVTRAVFGYFGVRDMALGVCALAATRPGGDVPKQVAAQGVADTVDGGVIVALLVRGRLPRLRAAGMVALAAGSAVAEYVAAARLRRVARSS